MCALKDSTGAVDLPFHTGPSRVGWKVCPKSRLVYFCRLEHSITEWPMNNFKSIASGLHIVYKSY
jgi:hypothetical protein